jgi:hypothetical protein
LADSRETLALEYRSLVKDESNLKESIETKEKSHLDIIADLKILQSQLEALDTELKTVMVQTLSETEHRLLGELITKSDNLKERLSTLSKERFRVCPLSHFRVAFKSRNKLLTTILIQIDWNAQEHP